MKEIVSLFILLLILITGASSYAEIEIKYDRFQDRTTVWTNPKKETGSWIQPGLILIGYYEGRTPSKPAKCILGCVLRVPNWIYLKCYHLSCLADGKPVSLPPSEHKGSVGKSYIVERIYVSVPFSVIEQHLSKCEKVEFKLWNQEFALSNYDIEDLKFFVEAFAEKKYREKGSGPTH